MLSLNIKALQNVCVKKMDPSFSKERFAKSSTTLDAADEGKADDVSQATVTKYTSIGTFVMYVSARL